jgi:hypothetical protein
MMRQISVAPARGVSVTASVQCALIRPSIGLSSADAFSIRTILNHQRHFVRTPGEIELVLVLVANEVEALETGVEVQPCDAERVIVIPQSGGLLVVRIAIDLLLEGRACLGKAVGEPRLRVAVALGKHLQSVHVDDGADLRGRRLGAVDCGGDLKHVTGGKVIAPPDGNGMSTADIEGGPGVLAVVSPQERRCKIAMQLLAERRHPDLEQRCTPSLPETGRVGSS